MNFDQIQEKEIDPLRTLSDAQLEFRSALMDAKALGQAINLGVAMQKLLTKDEQKFWNQYMEQEISGVRMDPLDFIKFDRLRIKLGLKMGPSESEVKDSDIETKKKDFTIESYVIDSDSKAQIIKELESQDPPEGFCYLYRGVKGEWESPSLSDQEFEIYIDENDDLVEALVKGKNSSSDYERLKNIREILKSESNQWFTDDLKLASSDAYIGNKGTLVRMAVRMKDVYMYMKESGHTPGGWATNFVIPREWFLKT